MFEAFVYFPKRQYRRRSFHQIHVAVATPCVSAGITDVSSTIGHEEDSEESVASVATVLHVPPHPREACFHSGSVPPQQQYWKWQQQRDLKAMSCVPLQTNGALCSNVHRVVVMLYTSSKDCRILDRVLKTKSVYQLLRVLLAGLEEHYGSAVFRDCDQ